LLLPSGDVGARCLGGRWCGGGHRSGGDGAQGEYELLHDG
jgi:hypothetical protein